MTYVISKEIGFDSAHRVPLHASKCRNLHGHRYRVVAHVEGELITEGPESGMVRDFSIVKELLTTRVHDKYDHGTIIYDGDDQMMSLLVEGYQNDQPVFVNDWKVEIVDFIPTAECLAKSIFEDLKANGLPGLLKIELWETPTSMASYAPDESLESIEAKYTASGGTIG